MQALGLIETRGLVVAIESADAMLKAAEVSLIEKTYVGGGLVSIAVTGEVAAVKAAVEAGAAAVRQINSSLLVSQHVIPRPHQELDDVIITATPLKNIEMPTVVLEKSAPDKEDEVEQIVEIVEETHIEVKDTVETAIKIKEDIAEDLDKLHKEEVDKIVFESGLEEAVVLLSKLKVMKLRNLAREYNGFSISGRLVSKADKQMLIEAFRQYYEHN